MIDDQPQEVLVYPESGQLVLLTGTFSLEKAIEASSVNIFKGHVDKFLKNVGGLYISLSKLSAPVTRTTVSSPVV